MSSAEWPPAQERSSYSQTARNRQRPSTFTTVCRWLLSTSTPPPCHKFGLCRIVSNLRNCNGIRDLVYLAPIGCGSTAPQGAHWGPWGAIWNPVGCQWGCHGIHGQQYINKLPIDRSKHYWYSDAKNPTKQFPAPGISQEMIIFATGDPKTFFRANNDYHFLAWLQEAKDSDGDPQKKELFRSAADGVMCG